MQMSLGDLLNKIEAAKHRMSRHNPHRLLFGQCEQALLQLVARLEKDTALTQPRTTAAEQTPLMPGASEAPPAV